MKSLFSFIIAAFLLANCGEKKDATTKEEIASNATVKSEDPTPVSASGSNSLVGTWKLRLEVFDDNSNRVPDEEELKKGYANNYMLQLNADGSCRIQQVFTGRYEKKVEDGRDMLYVYRKKVEGEEDKDPIPDIFQITSLKKDELVLQIIDAAGPSSFWFFKRIK